MTGRSRRRYSKKEKEALVDGTQCYVCADLNLDHAGFDGYALADIDLDHYREPFSSVGSEDGQVLPVHSVTRGSSPDDPDYETSTRRNCHGIRRADFHTRSDYVGVLRARLEARTARFLDDVYENKVRKGSDRQYRFNVKWSDTSADFRDRTHPVIEESRRGVLWRRFFTRIEPRLLFTDRTSQVRPATLKSVHRMLHTFMVEGFPVFAPINVRVDKCGHIVVFDGNHRATAFALAFGVDEPLPVMVWDIKPDATCGLLDSFVEEASKARANKGVA